MRNARFWVHYNGSWVKLRLQPGQTLKHAHCNRTDEGWYSEWNSWALAGDVVQWEWCEDGADCDGRYSRGGVMACKVDQLATNDCRDFGGQLAPSWETEERFQRDHNAELAGY